MAILIMFGFGFAGDSFAGGVRDFCREVLARSSSRYTIGSYGTLETWRAKYERAKAEGNEAGAAYALTHILTLKSDELGFDTRTRHNLSRLRTLYESVFESRVLPNRRVMEEMKTMPPWSAVTGMARILGFSGDIIFVSRDSLGDRIPFRRRLARFFLSGLKDLGWAAGPFMWKMFAFLIGNYQIPSSSLANLQLALLGNDSFFGIKRDDFFVKVSVNYFADRELVRARVGLQADGMLSRPAIIAAGAYFLFLQATLADPMVEGPTPEEYTAEEYLTDIEGQGMIQIEGRDVGVIVDEGLFAGPLARFMLSGVLDPNPAKALKSLAWLQEVAERFESISTSNDEEFFVGLRELRSRGYDLIVIVYHGRPGDFRIGGEGIRENLARLDSCRFGKGTDLVFISCDFGDVESDENEVLPGDELNGETFALIADRLGMDRAAAAVENLRMDFNFQGDPREVRDAVDGLTFMMAGFTSWGIHATGTLHLTIVYSLLFGESIADTEFGRELGFRVYDTETGQIEFFPSQSNQ